MFEILCFTSLALSVKPLAIDLSDHFSAMKKHSIMFPIVCLWKNIEELWEIENNLTQLIISSFTRIYQPA